MKITLAICITFILCFVLFLIFNPLKGEKSETTKTQNEQVEKTSVTPETQKITQPDAENYPWNAGERVPDKILAEVLPVGEIPSNTIGGFGVIYDSDKKNSVTIFLFDDSLKAVQKTCEGGGIRNGEDFVPEIKGSWSSETTGNTWIPEQMSPTEVKGRKCWVVKGIDVNDYAYHQLGICIFIGFSKQGGPKEAPNRGWDKYLFDQRQRAKMTIIPGTYTNGGGGANCWYKVR